MFSFIFSNGPLHFLETQHLRQVSELGIGPFLRGLGFRFDTDLIQFSMWICLFKAEG